MSRSATTLNVVLKLNTPQALIAFLTARSEIPRMYAVDNEALVRSNEMKSQLLETFSAEFCKLLYAYVDDRCAYMPTWFGVTLTTEPQGLRAVCLGSGKSSFSEIVPFINELKPYLAVTPYEIFFRDLWEEDSREMVFWFDENLEIKRGFGFDFGDNDDPQTPIGLWNQIDNRLDGEFGSNSRQAENRKAAESQYVREAVNFMPPTNIKLTPNKVKEIALDDATHGTAYTNYYKLSK